MRIDPGWVVLAAIVGFFAGAFAVTQMFFWILAARLGPLYNGEGESGLAMLATVPYGGAVGAALAATLLKRASAPFSMEDRKGRRNFGQYAADRFLHLLTTCPVVMVPVAFLLGCLALAVLLQFTVGV